MYDKTLLLEILKQVDEAVHKVIKRFEPVSSVDFLTDSPEGMEKLDSICMLIIAIGESFKNIDKITNNIFLKEYPEVDWKGVKGMRDIISHHYFDVDAEQIYWVCENEMPTLALTLKKMIRDLQAD